MEFDISLNNIMTIAAFSRIEEKFRSAMIKKESGCLYTKVFFLERCCSILNCERNSSSSWHHRIVNSSQHIDKHTEHKQ